MLRYENVASKENDFLAMTGYTTREFTALLPQFQMSYDEYLSEYTIEGYERTGPVPTTYHNSPLPTIEDKMLFILVFLKQNPTQIVQGYLFGMSQPNANKWIHLLHTVLNRALDAQGCLPNRDMKITEQADQGEDGVGSVSVSSDTSPTPSGADKTGHQPSPFFSMMGQSDRSIDLAILMSSNRIIVARRNNIPSKIS
jgi:Helix-turn-helix of DDE superfamily endonuclease